MKTEAISLAAARHRLLEGVLLRLARQPDREEYVLRGGMLMRHWFRPEPRIAEDIDFVVSFPLDVEGVARRFAPVLADQAVTDGVIFDTERVRFEAMFLDTGSPAVRVFASGEVDGLEVDFHIDLTFGPYPRPEPVFASLPTESGERAVLKVCRPETVVAQKIQALCHLGMLGWRQKDLNDLRLLLSSVPQDVAALRAAIAAYMADLGRSGCEVRAVFGPSSWWGTKLCSARWLDFVKASHGQEIPKNLTAVVSVIADRLAPALEGLP